MTATAVLDAVDSPTTEFAARDREETLLAYLDTLLRSAADDVEEASEGLPQGDHARAALSAMTTMMMASEHVTELRRLAGRRIAGARARR